MERPSCRFYKFHYNGHALDYHDEQKEYMGYSDHEKYLKHDGEECMVDVRTKHWVPGKGWAVEAAFARYHEADVLVVWLSELEEIDV